MRSKAAQMLRKATELLGKASREAAKTSNTYAELYFPGVSNKFTRGLPKRVKNLHKKALQKAEEQILMTKKSIKEKGWPRGYEFGTHRMPRKLRPNDWHVQDKGGFAW